MKLGSRDNQTSFATIPDVYTPRSVFDRSHSHKTTMDFDVLVPVYVDEVLPGDTINLKTKHFARLAPQVRPVMDNMYLNWEFFFVPNRLVWDNWEKFMGARTNPADSIDFLIPILQQGSAINNGTIGDYMGLVTEVPIVPEDAPSALPLRAYNLIWNEWYRDQNLQNSVSVPTGNGPDALSTYSLLKRNKKHDYFTSCLPSPQKGAAVTLPLGTSAPVIGIGKITNGSFDLVNQAVRDSRGQTPTYTVASLVRETANNAYAVEGTAATNGFPNIRADLSNATAATINQLRLAFMTQSLLELDMRGGTRYVEILKAHFNVISPDFRLQRPEILSASRVPFQQHPLTQTAATQGSGATLQQLGQLSAFTTSADMSGDVGFSKSFVEHGYVIGLCSATADLTYQQGLNKMWSRKTRYDFFWPKLQELGEQSVLTREIFYANNTTQNNTVFGFQERYAEYKYKPSIITGQFRGTFAQSLDVWHLAEEFGTVPALNSTFIQSNTPIERALIVPDATYPHILMDIWFDIKHVRPMMAYGTPASLGRF